MKKKITRKDDCIPDYDHLFTEGPSAGKSKTRFLKKLLRMNAVTVFLSSLVYIVQAAPLYVTPLISADLIDLVALAVTQGEDVTLRIVVESALLALVILSNVPTTRLRWRMVSGMLRDMSAGIKCSVVRKLQSLSITYHKDMETGKLQSKFLKDTDSVDQLLSVIMMTIIPNVINALIATGISIYKNGIVSLFFLVVIPCNVMLSLAFNKPIRRGYRELRVSTENMSSKLNGMLEMLPVTKSHGLENTEIEGAERAISRVRGSGLSVDRTTASFGAWSYVTNTLLSAACLVFCIFLAIRGYISVGEVFLYQSMFSSLSSYITVLANSLPQIGAGSEAFESIAEIMNSRDVEINSGKFTPPDIEGGIAFQNVSYRYPNCDQDVIHDFSLDVNPGECIAVVGASGSGKSTLMNLIIGFMRPTQGKILIDGKDLNEYDLSEYRHRLSVVPQSSILFSGTIRENITYGLARYGEEELNRVLEEANVKEFLDNLPEGVDTSVGEHGGKLSGGQKQRITIARALIRSPRILILDEATSALDNVSELHVQKAISSAAKGRTTFIVAHRLSTIRDADRIVVMKEGYMVECGSYEELMEKKGEFYRLKNLSEIKIEQN